MSKQIDLGEATAYAIAKKHGYVGTEAQFAAEMTGAAESARAAAQDASDAEAYAIGKRDGTDVPSTDPAYQNNAKYWSQQAPSVTSIAPAYSASSTYAVGDYVTYNNKLYECTTAITTAEAWNSSHWTETSISSEVTDLKSDLSVLEPSATSSDVGKTLKVKTVSGGKVTEYEFGESSGDDTEDLYTSIPPALETVLFTSDDVNVGDGIKYEITLPENPGASSGQTGIIDLLDSQGTRIAYYGRGTSTDTTTVFNGEFLVPDGFATAKWRGVKLPLHLYIAKRVYTEDGSVRYSKTQELTETQKKVARDNIGATSDTVDLSEYPTHTGWLSGDNTWTQLTLPSKHYVIPVEYGETVTVKAKTNLYIALFQEYIEPTTTGQAASIVSGYGRMFLTPGTEETIVVPQKAKYLYVGLNTGNDGTENQYAEYIKKTYDDAILSMCNFLGNSIAETDEVDVSKYPTHTGWLSNTNIWTQMDVPSKHCIIPVEVGEEISITVIDANYIALFTSYTEPIAWQSANVVSGYGRTLVAAGTTYTLTVPNTAKYLYVGINDGNTGSSDKRIESLTIPSLATENTLSGVIEESVYSIVEDGIKGLTFGTPIEIFSNTDSSATELDSRLIGMFSIIQVSDSMYYMYYDGYGPSDDIYANAYVAKPLFAYSTDGIHYTRGFPSGITPPFPGTNRILTNDSPSNIIFNSVFKCCDPVYPFRLICQELEGTGIHRINMYKSADGINFDRATKKTLRYEYHDTQNIAICRGNVLKVYFRENEHPVISGVTHHNRRLSVAFYDLDGNVLSPYNKLSLNYVYNSAATPINDVEEIIIPTHFDSTTESGGYSNQSFSFESYKVNKYHVSALASNLDSILTSDDHFALFMGGFISISGTQYMAYKTQNIDHDDSTSTNRIYKYKLVPITMQF